VEEENQEYEDVEIKVDPKQQPIRIDKFLLTKLANVSRTRIQNAVSEGEVLVNGKVVKSNYKINPGEMITFSLPRRHDKNDKVVPEDIPLDIVYEDEDVMVINKPAGLVMHPGVGNWTGTLVNGLMHYLGNTELPVREGEFYDRPGLVHRIDKDTSGIIVVAKSTLAMDSLTKQFFDHTIKRKYKALIWGALDEEKGTVDNYIGRNPANRLVNMVFPEENIGKRAITHWKVLEDLYYVSLVECQLETGRTHQIRVHMKHLGHPLFSDARYEGDQIRKGTVFTKYKQFVQNVFKIMPRQALHAYSLGFEHPRTKEQVYFEQELPPDFAECLEKWRHYVSYRKELI
jgi:23S rRNA pseudouridine1911/1915/1917 synthase